MIDEQILIQYIREKMAMTTASAERTMQGNSGNQDPNSISAMVNDLRIRSNTDGKLDAYMDLLQQIESLRIRPMQVIINDKTI